MAISHFQKPVATRRNKFLYLFMREFLENQFQNMFLWVPFIMLLGAALYFTLPFEPNLVCPAIFALVFIIIAFIPRVGVVGRGLALFAFGFCYAVAFTNFIATPQITKTLRNLEITGTVQNLDYTPDKVRIYINVESINPNSSEHMLIRVSAGEDIPVPHIGDKVRATVTLFRPGGADAPGTFDYARWAYFNHLSATGYITNCTILESGHSDINAMRDFIHRKSHSFLVDSLVLGYKNAVPETDASIWTANGIAHVWSISGFHMTLVSGWMFAVFFLIFRTIPYVTKRVPARIPAMICALICLIFYLFLSGAGIATIRAFIMTCLVFAAVIFGRNAVSMRNICMAMCALFLINPHYVMQAGFQLSFAAVFGLIWFWNTFPKMPHNKFLKIIYAAAMTSIVATVFTMPFTAAHFGSVPIYGLIGNLILLPLFSLIIMPLVLIGAVCATIGFMGPINMANLVYGFALRVAEYIADLPHAVILTPNISNTAIILFVMSGLSLMFIRPIKVKINYILLAFFVTAGILVTALQSRPIFYATADHELVGFVENGKLTFNKSRASNHFFTFDTWKQLNGEQPGTKNIRRKHNHGVYIYKTQNFNLAYIQKFAPLSKNILNLCRDTDIDYIVSYFDIDAPKCNHKILRGGFVIYKSGTVKFTPRARRWHNPPKQNTTRPQVP